VLDNNDVVILCYFLFSLFYFYLSRFFSYFLLFIIENSSVFTMYYTGLGGTLSPTHSLTVYLYHSFTAIQLLIFQHLALTGKERHAKCIMCYVGFQLLISISFRSYISQHLDTHL